MSMEQSIDKLADAILALAKAMGAQQTESSGQRTNFAVSSHGTPKEEAPGKPAVGRTAQGKSAKSESTAESRSETPPAKETTPAATEPAAEATGEVDQTESQAEAQREYDYERDVKPLFIKLIQKRGRDAGKALIAEYNPDAAKLPEAITAEQYGDVIARINELLED